MSKYKEGREEKQIEPRGQRNEDRVGEARSWERGGEIRARTLGMSSSGMPKRVETTMTYKALFAVAAQHDRRSRGCQCDSPFAGSLRLWARSSRPQQTFRVGEVFQISISTGAGLLGICLHLRPGCTV